MDVELYHRRPQGDAEDHPTTDHNVVRAETTVVANDGQQFGVMLLDADDTFDVVVQWPNNEREIVWSLVRERTLEG